MRQLQFSNSVGSVINVYKNDCCKQFLKSISTRTWTEERWTNLAIRPQSMWLELKKLYSESCYFHFKHIEQLQIPSLKKPFLYGGLGIRWGPFAPMQLIRIIFNKTENIFRLSRLCLYIKYNYLLNWAWEAVKKETWNMLLYTKYCYLLKWPWKAAPLK